MVLAKARSIVKCRVTCFRRDRACPIERLIEGRPQRGFGGKNTAKANTSIVISVLRDIGCTRTEFPRNTCFTKYRGLEICLFG